jgi:hypothetical protein
MLFFVLIPIIIRVVKTKKFETKTAMYTLIGGLVFAYSFFYGVKALFLVYLEEFKQYSLPSGYDGYIVLGILTFISVTFLSYYEMGFKDLLKRERISEKKVEQKKEKIRKKDFEEAIVLIQKQIEQIDNLKNKRETADFHEWKNMAESLIRTHFGEKSSTYKNFLKISYFIEVGGIDETTQQKTYENGLETAKGILKACINELTQR